MQALREFFTTRTGVFTVLGVLLLGVLWVMNARQSRDAHPNVQAGAVVSSAQPTPTPASFKSTRRTSGTETVVMPAPSPTPTPYIVHTAAPTPTPPAATPTPGPGIRIAFFDAPARPRPTPTPAPTPASRLGDDDAAQQAQATPIPVRQISDTFAPYGSMIKCQTVFTVDSSNAETPVVALVTEELWQNGNLVIPAGTKVHGTASAASVSPGSLPTGERWVLVFPTDRTGERVNGSELTIRGMALQRAEKGADGKHWSVEDGAYGLKGYTVDSQNLNRIRKFLATFISAGSAGLQTTQTQGGGAVGLTNVVATTPRNAALGGLTAVLADEAASIQREIELHGSYTRVPGGTPFYLYCQQTVDARDARVGDSQAYVTGAPSQLRDQGNNPSVRSFLAQQDMGTGRRTRTGTGTTLLPASDAGAYPNNGTSGAPYYAQPGRPGYTYRYTDGVVPNPPAAALAPESQGSGLPVP